jgi:hypothetical protein
VLCLANIRFGRKRDCFLLGGALESVILHSNMGGSAKTSEKCCRANLRQLTRFSRCSATQKTSGSFLTVVDFVAVRAPKNHKDQQG